MRAEPGIKPIGDGIDVSLVVGEEGHESKYRELAALYGGRTLYGGKKNIMEHRAEFFGSRSFSIVLTVKGRITGAL